MILYSTGCPKCNVLKKKLEEKDVSFEITSDIQPLIDKGIMSAPVLEVDGEFLLFPKAIEYVNNL